MTCRGGWRWLSRPDAGSERELDKEDRGDFDDFEDDDDGDAEISGDPYEILEGREERARDWERDRARRRALAWDSGSELSLRITACGAVSCSNVIGCACGEGRVAKV